MSGNGNRHDLIIGMTLAEVFLLALLVGWLGTRDEITAITVGAQALSDEVQRLKSSLANAEAERDKAKREYEELLKILEKNGIVIGPGGELLRFGEKPKCDAQDNVLVHVTMRDGQIATQLLRSFKSYPAGTSLSDAQSRQFVKEVRVASDSEIRVKGVAGCRWQYVLEFQTDSDYRRGRQTFEEAFYVKQLIEIGSR